MSLRYAIISPLAILLLLDARAMPLILRLIRHYIAD